MVLIVAPPLVARECVFLVAPHSQPSTLSVLVVSCSYSWRSTPSQSVEVSLKSTVKSRPPPPSPSLPPVGVSVISVEFFVLRYMCRPARHLPNMSFGPGMYRTRDLFSPQSLYDVRVSVDSGGRGIVLFFAQCERVGMRLWGSRRFRKDREGRRNTRLLCCCGSVCLLLQVVATYELLLACVRRKMVLFCRLERRRCNRSRVKVLVDPVLFLLWRCSRRKSCFFSSV